MALGPLDLGGLTVKELGRRLWHEMVEDNVWDAGAQLGYYFMLALFPLLIFILSLSAFIPTEDLITPVMTTLRDVMPGQAYNLISREINRIMEASSGSVLTFGMLGTMWAASSGVVSLVGTLNRAYDVKEERGFLRLRMTAVALTFALAALLITGAVLLTSGDVLASWVVYLLGFELAGTIASLFVNYALGLGMLFVGFELIYYYGPNVKDQAWVWVSPGSLAGVVLFVLSSLGFSSYVRFSDTYSATYGSIGAVIVLMLWLYLLGLSIVLGGEMNAVIATAAADRGQEEAPDVGTEETKEGEDRARRKSPAAPTPPRGPQKPPVPVLTPAAVPVLEITSETAASSDLVERDLLRSLHHSNSRIRASTAMALGRSGVATEPVIASLVARLGDPELEVREKAMQAVVRIGRPALPHLDRLAADGNAETARVARETVDAIHRSARALLRAAPNGDGAGEP